MVNGPQQPGSRYVTNSDGAPPVPPPGGYKAAKRVPSLTPGLPDGAPLPIEAWNAPAGEQKKPAWLGIAALSAAVVFVIVLIVSLATQATDAIYSVNMIAAQLAVLALVIVALFTKRGRALGASALVLTLVFNVATVGALTAVRTSVAGSYTNTRSEADKFWEAYPGAKSIDEATVLAQPSLEAVRSRVEAAYADVRAALSDEFGYTWTSTPELVKPERNGYGGESMLQNYTSESWFTNEPVQDFSRKHDIMGVIEDVMVEHGFTSLTSINDPSYGLTPDILKKMFGSADPATQPQWEWYSYDWDSDTVLYFDIIDLSLDTTGEFTAARQAMHDRTGEPMEGIQLVALGEYLLSEQDVDAFRDAMSKYP